MTPPLILTALCHRRPFAFALTLALSGLLAACGGGGDSEPTTPATPAAETLFVPANAWGGAAPADAAGATPDEFRRRVAAGEWTLATPVSRQEQAAARRSHINAERSFLQAQTDLSDTMKALLAQASAAPDLDADAVAALPDGRQIALNNLGTSIENAAESYRRARDPVLALAAYDLSYTMLGDDIKAQVPAPAALAGGTLEQIRQAAQQLEAALATLPDVDNTRLDADAPVAPLHAPGGGRKQALAAGNGVDNNGLCAPTGYARRYWFPLRNFVSPVKNQGERGLCWAFAAIAAVESREQVQNGSTPNLSEQFLANKVKLEWGPSDVLDGGSAAFALNAAEDRFQRLVYETAWTYNPSFGRPDNAFAASVVGTAASYAGACKDYSGTCSETAHQSQQVCTVVAGMNFCGYVLQQFPDLASTGLRASRVLPVWTAGTPFNSWQVRAHLAAGRSLIATFPVYEGFMAAPNTGIVSDYRRQMKDKNGVLVDGRYGDHLAQIVGFISNAQLSLPGGPPSDVPGGGYYILRNSWGCVGAGDAGYYYVPADYLANNFTSLEVLDILPNRSARWNAEQVTPGGTAGLRVVLRNGAATGLRTPSNLAGDILVDHPVASYARLTVTSDRDGLLFDGQWLVNPPVGGSLFANALPVTFQTEGPRQVTLVARYGSQQVTTTNTVVALNSAPQISIDTPADSPRQGENFVVNATATDVNEANPAGLCATMAWSVTAPDTIVSGSGCARVIRFGVMGRREVRVSAQDREGLQASAAGSFDVAPPPANPYPRVAGFAVLSRDVLRIDNQAVGCISNTVADNTVIDLRQVGCKLSLLGPDVSRQFSQLNVENPSGEALSYDWSYTDYYPNGNVTPRASTQRTSTPSFELNRFLYVGLSGATASTYRCNIDVRVNAPDAARSKTLRVWSGQCINVDVGPR